MNKKPSVTKLLNSHEETDSKLSGKRLLDIRDAAERLACSERFVSRLVQERRIPFIRLGGTRIRFLAADLDQWIADQRVPAVR
jgi:excisionase family DNA binding protein